MERVWYGLGRAFAAKGHEVVHISRLSDNLPSQNMEDGVQHLRISGYDTPRELWRLKYRDLLYSLRAKRALPKGDILVTNTFWLPFLVRTGAFGKLCVHVARYPKGQMKFYSHASRLQAVSSMIAEAILSQSPGLASITKVLPNQLDGQWYVESEHATSSRKGIVFVGRIHPEKGVHLLFQAFAKLSDADTATPLVVVGPSLVEAGGGGDSYVKELQQLVKDLRIRVNWIGPIYDVKQLISYYDQAQVFVYPSTAEKGEAMPVAPLEAMARGCIPILSHMKCFSDYAVDNVNCVYFDHRKDPVESLSMALSKTLHHPSLDSLKNEAQSTARRYELGKVANLYLDDFFELINSDTSKQTR